MASKEQSKVYSNRSDGRFFCEFPGTPEQRALLTTPSHIVYNTVRSTVKHTRLRPQSGFYTQCSRAGPLTHENARVLGTHKRNAAPRAPMKLKPVEGNVSSPRASIYSATVKSEKSRIMTYPRTRLHWFVLQCVQTHKRNTTPGATMNLKRVEGGIQLC